MPAEPENAGSGAPVQRPSIGMLWKCCNVYSRVYLNHEGTHFAGNCPRCGARARIRAIPSQTARPEFWVAE